MDLKSILEKNKSKAEKHPFKPSIPSIAAIDRPYVIDFNDKDNEEIVEPPPDKVLMENNLKQTKEKQVTNGYQTGNKEVSQQVTNGYQTGIKQVSKKPTHTVPNEQTGNKEVSQQVTMEMPNGYQTGNKEVSQQVTKELSKQTTKSTLTTLVGVQRSIILFFYFLTKKNVSQLTPPLTLDYLSNALGTKKSVIKITIIRLQKKGLLLRNTGKTGRGGWTIYELSNVLYKELMQQDNFGFLEDKIGIKQVTNGYQTGNKEVSQQVSQQVTAFPSSSSFNINETTTTNPARALPEPWQNVDYSLLSEFGFTESHLLQLLEREIIDPNIIQDSIYHFAYDLKYNNKRTTIKGDTINFFMGILSKGRPYTRPANYISPQEKDLKTYFDAKEQERKRIEDLDQKLQGLEFQGWYDKLSDEELATIIPSELNEPNAPHILGSIKQSLKTRHLRQYFKDFIWPERRRQLTVTRKVELA